MRSDPLSEDLLDQRFTRGEVQRITGATPRQLDYWSRLGLLHPRARWGERFFGFADLVAVETLNRLAARRVPAGRLLRAMDALAQGLGSARAPLSSLRVSTNGARVVVHEPGPAGRPIEPLTGQWVLDFETAPIERKVHALGLRTAEEWFESGMALDADPKTFRPAVEAYRHAIESMPGWVEAHINLGTTLYQLGETEEARDAFATAVALEPANVLAHFNLGCVHERLGNTSQAIEEFRAALERTPHMADAHLNLALAYEKTGRKTDALRHLGLYLRFEPNGLWAEYARTRLNTIQRRPPAGKVTPFRRTRP
jgi:tetratricopeptide (TPR) repeat protein